MVILYCVFLQQIYEWIEQSRPFMKLMEIDFALNVNSET